MVNGGRAIGFSVGGSRAIKDEIGGGKYAGNMALGA